MFAKMALVALAATGFIASAPAQATVLTYNVSGTFTNGATLSGSFSFDDEGAALTQFTSAIFTISNIDRPFDATIFEGFTAGYDQNRNTTFRLTGSGDRPLQFVSVVFFADYNNTNALRAVTSTSLSTNRTNFSYGTFYSSFGQHVQLSSGTVTLATPAVPEPATWAMMLLGFGMVGAASRYRRRSARVASA